MRGLFTGMLLALLLGPVQARVHAQTDCTPEALEKPYEQSPHKMPLFRGCEVSQVQQVIRRLELRAEYPSISNAAPAGTIVFQDPEPGTIISAKTALTLSVSNGVAPAGNSARNPGTAGKQPSGTSQAQPIPYGGTNPNQDSNGQQPHKIPAPGPAPSPQQDQPGTNVAADTAAGQGMPDRPEEYLPPKPATKEPCSQLRVMGDDPQGNFRAGQPVSFVFTVACAYTGAGTTAIWLRGTAVNLRGLGIGGVCTTPICFVPLPPNGSLKLDVSASPARPGAFYYTLHASPRQKNGVYGSDALWVLSGTAAPSSSLWMLGMAAAFIAAMGTAAVMLRNQMKSRRERRWKESFHVHGKLTAEAGYATALPLRGPVVRVRVQVQTGSGSAAGHMPVVKKEPYDS